MSNVSRTPTIAFTERGERGGDEQRGEREGTRVKRRGVVVFSGLRHAVAHPRRYIDQSKLQDAISESITTILRERPDNPVKRMAELLAVWGPRRYNTLMPSPPDAKFKFAVIQFKVPGAKNGGSDKGPDGNRIDSIPIANGIVKAGGACDMVLYDFEKHDDFCKLVEKYDALLVRINPGQLSQGTSEGTQQRFDALMNSRIAAGCPVWSSPGVQTQMGAKDALVMIKELSCGLPDTFAYYSEEDLVAGFKKTCAFQPRVIKQNRGSAGEGIWLCWLEDKEYCKQFGVPPPPSPSVPVSQAHSSPSLNLAECLRSPPLPQSAPPTFRRAVQLPSHPLLSCPP